MRCKHPTIPLTALALLGSLLHLGCTPANMPQRRVIEVKHEPLEIVRAQLERYVAGQTVDSERELFSTWVKDVRATDPNAAELLAKGFAEIDSRPTQARAIARRLLEKLP